MNEYEQQAVDFLQKTKTSFVTEFLKFDYHWQGDKHKRNIFKITLSNDKHSYSFNFGASLNDSLENCKDLIYEEYLDFYAGLKYEGMPKQKYLSYSDKIPISEIQRRHESSIPLESLISKSKAEQIYKEFKAANTSKHVNVNIMPVGEWIDKLKGAMVKKCYEIVDKNFGKEIQTKTISHPNAYDILACLQKGDPGTFENFCGDFGYDQDSRKAEKTYHAVVDEWKNIEKLFTEEELELLQEIQ